MKIRPLHDRVIVKRLEEERTSPGGIVIPDTAAEKPVQGKIVAVGKGKILEDGNVRPLDVKVGDNILFGKYSGTEVKVDGDDLLVMREEDVMAVIEKKSERNLWQLKKYDSVTMPGRACSAASISLRTPSRRRWVPKAAMPCSRRASAPP